MTLTRTTAALVALLAVVGAVGGAAAVPDARITIDAVDASSNEPAVGERTTLNVSLSNSGGSPAAADVTSVRLRDADGSAGLRDEATGVGALSAGDATDVELRTTFEEPGEHRLTVEAVADQEAVDGAESAGSVTVSRDVVVDVQPAAVDLGVRARALDPDDLRSDESDQAGSGGVSVGGIEGVFGGDGGLDAGGSEESERLASAESPIEVTVVNTGTSTADRVSLTAVGTAVDASGGDEDASNDAADTTVEAGPYAVEAVAPGEERRVVVDLGPLDRRSDVTVTAAFRSGTDAREGVGAERTAESTVRYPTRDGSPTVTDATVQAAPDGTVAVDANLANAGTEEIEGVVVSIAGADGVSPTPAGESYFVGTVGASDFVAFDLETTANASVADAIPIRIAYTERGVRYTKTATVALPESAGSGTDSGGDGGAVGTLGSIGVGGIGPGDIGIGAIGVAGIAGLAVVGGVARRRDV
ncbi:CARDB domain-containing protein [Halorubrum sp. BV1]|uniref:CARDB domain-containing protein n=1 Tax=Halorubrum sp. BV1 TaxID=1498500 RepID=UPI0009B5A8EE|nr:CARDB domain-containing protein [Halorubrum sp. BV1]